MAACVSVFLCLSICSLVYITPSQAFLYGDTYDMSVKAMVKASQTFIQMTKQAGMKEAHLEWGILDPKIVTNWSKHIELVRTVKFFEDITRTISIQYDNDKTPTRVIFTINYKHLGPPEFFENENF